MTGKRTTHFLWLLVMCICFSRHLPVLAADGDFVASFDDDGVLLFDGSNGLLGLYSVAPTYDGKLFFAGYSSASGGIIAKANADGSLDSSFGTGGLVELNVGVETTLVTDIVVQMDGRILVTGGAFPVAGDRAVFVARLDPDGSLDTGFGNGGVAFENVFPGSSNSDVGSSLMLFDNGRIAVGVSTNLILGFTSDGQLDPDWFNNGWLPVPTDMTGGGLAVDSKGRMVVAVAPIDFFIAVPEIRLRRYYQEGFLDSDFGNGQVLVDVIANAEDFTMDIEIDCEDRIYLAGFSETGSFSSITYESWVVRLLANGDLDTSFGSGGIAEVTTPAHSSLRARGIQLLPDGRVMVFAETTLGDPDDEVVITALHTDGTIDNSFGLGGYQRADTVPSSNTFFLYRWNPGFAVLPTGNVVVAAENCTCAVMIEAGPWDTTVDDFQFSAFSAVSPGSNQESTVELSGAGVDIYVPYRVGDGSISRNGDEAFSIYSGRARNNDQVTMRHESAEAFGATTQSWFEIGGIQPKNNKQVLLGETTFAVMESTTMPVVLGRQYSFLDHFPRMINPMQITFEGYANPGEFFDIGNPASFSENEVQITSNTNGFILNYDTYGTGSYISIQRVFDEVIELDIDPGPDVTGFAFRYQTFGAPLTVTIDGSQTFELPAPSPNTLAFFGFAREVPINSIHLSASEYILDFDNFTTSTQFSFPVPLLMRRQSDQRWIGYELSDADVLDVEKLPMSRSSDYEVVARADFNGDSRPDVLLRDTVGGQNGRWVLYTLDATGVLSEGFADLTRNRNWQLQAVADMDGDGRADVLMRNTADYRWLQYLMNGQNVIAQSVIPLSTDPAMGFKAMGDFDGDGRQDVLLRDAAGSWRIHLMRGLGFASFGSPPITPNLNFDVVAVRDFDNDGKDDILLRRTDGRWFMYLMDGLTIKDSGSPAFVENMSWNFEASADFDGSGTDDVLIRRDDGRWYMYAMDGFSIVDEGVVDMTRNTEFEIVSVDDFSADLKSDLLMRRSDGRWAVYFLDGPSVIGQGVPDISRNTDWVPYPHH